MPLSEREQKILDELERNLSDEEPRLAHERPLRSSENVRRARLGAFVVAFGFMLLIVFFLSRVLLVGLVSFGAMVAGIVLLAGPMGSLVDSAKEKAVHRGTNVKPSAGGYDQDIRRRFRRR